MTYCHTLCAMSISTPILRYNYFKILPSKSMVRVMCVVKGLGDIWPSTFKCQGHNQRSNPLVTFKAWSSIDMFGFHFMAIGPLLAEIKQISYLTVKIECQCHGQGKTWCSHLRSSVQSICLLFVSWQSDRFFMRYSKFHIWPWKLNVKVMAKVKSDGQIWALEFNQYVCFSFPGNGTIFGWDIGNSIFDLENWRSRSWRKSAKI